MKLTSKDRRGRWRVTVGVSPLVKECQGSGEGPPAFNLRGPRTRPRAPPLSEGALKRPHASGPQAVPAPEPGGGGSSILPPPPPPTTSACNNKWRRVSNPGQDDAGFKRCGEASTGGVRRRKAPAPRARPPRAPRTCRTRNAASRCAELAPGPPRRLAILRREEFCVPHERARDTPGVDDSKTICGIAGHFAFETNFKPGRDGGGGGAVRCAIVMGRTEVTGQHREHVWHRREVL